MQIPAFKKAADTNHLAANPPVLKPLPALAAVCINNSRLGLFLYRGSYGVFASSLLLVFSPYIVEQPLWLLALLLCWGGLCWGYCQQTKCCIAGAISFTDNHWLLEHEGHSCQMELAGEVLCWSWLVILPLRDRTSGNIRQLVLFNDALNKDDSARLRRWLRACLTPKT